DCFRAAPLRRAQTDHALASPHCSELHHDVRATWSRHAGGCKTRRSQNNSRSPGYPQPGCRVKMLFIVSEAPADGEQRTWFRSAAMISGDEGVKRDHRIRVLCIPQKLCRRIHIGFRRLSWLSTTALWVTSGDN